MTMKELHYNYVYFNLNYEPGGFMAKVSRDEFNNICLREAEGHDGICVLQRLMDHCPEALRYVGSKHALWSRKYGLPMNSIWFPLYFKNEFKEEKPLCFIIAHRMITPDYTAYLRKKYPGCKIVRLYRDTVAIDYSYPEYFKYPQHETYDLCLSFDERESRVLGYPHFVGPASKVEIPEALGKDEYDVFFCGKAKDRLDKLVKVYDILTAAGLRCKFIIVQAEEKILREGIEYKDRLIRYSEVLSCSAAARCLLDISQSFTEGVTPRFYEAVMYDKLLITDNANVRKSSFYRPDFIQVIQAPEDIDTEWFKAGTKVDHRYDGEFSPLSLIRRIDGLLTETR